MDTESRSFISTLDDYTIPLNRYLQDIHSHTQDFYKQESEWLPRQTQAINLQVQDLEKASKSLEANETVTEQSHEQLRKSFKGTHEGMVRTASNWSSTIIKSAESLCQDMEESGQRTYLKVCQIVFL